MAKNKGPDMLMLEPDLWRESSWLPSCNLFEPYDWRQLFGNEHPVEIELGAGDGSFMLEWARRHPDINFVVTERLLGRVRKIAKRGQEQKLHNLKALRLESAYFVRWLCPAASVSRVHIMFPDPWPKSRHHKHRLIQQEFLSSVRCILCEGGEVRFTTDHADYFSWAMEQWQQQPGWIDGGQWDASADPVTDFEKLFREEGRVIQRRRWVRA